MRDLQSKSGIPDSVLNTRAENLVFKLGESKPATIYFLIRTGNPTLQRGWWWWWKTWNSDWTTPELWMCVTIMMKWMMTMTMTGKEYHSMIWSTWNFSEVNRATVTQWFRKHWYMPFRTETYQRRCTSTSKTCFPSHVARETTERSLEASTNQIQ